MRHAPGRAAGPDQVLVPDTEQVALLRGEVGAGGGDQAGEQREHVLVALGLLREPDEGEQGVPGGGRGEGGGGVGEVLGVGEGAEPFEGGHGGEGEGEGWERREERSRGWEE